MTTTWAMLLLLAAKPAGSFDDLKSTAEVLERPGAAIEALIGECRQEDPVHQMECEENIKKAREDMKGKVFYVDLGAGHQDLLEFEGNRGSKARFLWVPMYDPGNGMPLTAEKPGKLNKDGWPVLKKKILDGPMPSGIVATDLRRLARLGQINIELIGQFQQPWSLRGKEKPVRGVLFKIKGLRLSQARTGEKVFDLLY